MTGCSFSSPHPLPLFNATSPIRWACNSDGMTQGESLSRFTQEPRRLTNGEALAFDLIGVP